MAGENLAINPDHFEYNPETGVVLYLVTGRPFCGEYEGAWIKLHRLAWFLKTGSWPKEVIDHINGNDTDNRWLNLRDVSQGVNMKNMRRHRRNTSGATGVYWRKDVLRWQSVITSDGKKHHLGYFEQFDEALSARKAAEVEHGFHPNHGEQR